jgi:cobalamin biosynthesis Mg chelatase CobN
MKFLSLSALAIVAVVNAQTPTPDACILTCAEQACPSEFSGANVTDYSCFCTTGTAQIIGCLNANCTAADLTTAEELATAVCGGKPPIPPTTPPFIQWLTRFLGGNSTAPAPAPAPASNGTASTSSGSSSPQTTVTSSTKVAPGGTSTGSSTAKASSAASSSSASNSNVVIGNGGIAGVLALAVALAVAVGVVA